MESCFPVLPMKPLGTLETNLRPKRCTEIIASATIQEHDFIAGFRPEAKPAYIELNSAARIERTVGVTVNNRANLIIDGSRGHGAAHAKVHKAALEQPENPDCARGLNLETKQPMQQPQIGADGAGDHAGGDRLGLVAFKVIGHFAFQNNVFAHVDAQPRAHTQHIQVGRLKAGKISIHAKVSVIFIVTIAVALG